MLIYISDIPGELFTEEPHTPVKHLKELSFTTHTVVKVKWQSHWVNFCSRTYEHLRQTLRPPHFATVPRPFGSYDSDERYRGEFMWSLWLEERVFIN